MNLLETLQEAHSKVICDKIVRYVGKDPKRFAALIKLYFKGESRIAQRAAWPMSYCVSKYPGLIEPYFKQLLDKAEEPGVHDAVIRNAMRLLQEVAIPEPFHGRVMNTCFGFIENNATPAAIKAFSLTILENLSKTYPDIKAELKLIIEERWEHETAAFRSRGKKILRAMKN